MGKSACASSLKCLYLEHEGFVPRGLERQKQKPHPVAFQLTGKQKPDLLFFASIANCLRIQKEERSRKATPRLN